MAHHILNSDGSVYIAASEPVPVVEKFPIREWIGWLLAGLCSRPLPMGARVPVAYLYNGVQLPDINVVWTDKVTYQYAALFAAGNSMYYMVLSNFPLIYRTRPYYLSGTSIRMYICYTDPAMTEGTEVQANTWWLTQEEVLSVIMYPTGVFWANHNVVDDNGNFIAASEPIPVYE